MRSLSRPWASEADLLILGHRGAPHLAPENTIAAFDLALAQGADGVELDVQRSVDGTPVVIHDETLERTTTGRGRVDAHTWEQLERLRCGRQPLPSLRDALTWASSAGARLNVEIKAPDVERAVVDQLRAAGMLERTIISSFDPAIVHVVGSIAPDALRYLLTDCWDAAAAEHFMHVRATGVCLRVDAASAGTLEILKARRIPVIVWTVDDPRRLRELMLMGVAGIITNHPRRAVAAARELGLREAPSGG